MLPKGSSGLPRGPIDPATRPRPWDASRASRAPSRLIFVTWPSYPCGASFRRWAPKVLVSTTSAPASRYSSCTARTIAGLETFSSSKQRFTNTPREYSIVPMAPSQTTTPSWRRSRNGFTAAALAFAPGTIQAV